MTLYKCWIPEYGQDESDGRDVDAYDAAGAACIYVEHYESKSSEYPVASGGAVVVRTLTDASAPEDYIVYGESRPSYYAQREKL